MGIEKSTGNDPVSVGKESNQANNGDAATKRKSKKSKDSESSSNKASPVKKKTASKKAKKNSKKNDAVVVADSTGRSTTSLLSSSSSSSPVIAPAAASSSCSTEDPVSSAKSPIHPKKHPPLSGQNNDDKDSTSDKLAKAQARKKAQKMKQAELQAAKAGIESKEEEIKVLQEKKASKERKKAKKKATNESTTHGSAAFADMEGETERSPRKVSKEKGSSEDSSLISTTPRPAKTKKSKTKDKSSSEQSTSQISEPPFSPPTEQTDIPAQPEKPPSSKSSKKKMSSKMSPEELGELSSNGKDVSAKQQQTYSDTKLDSKMDNNDTASSSTGSNERQQKRTDKSTGVPRPSPNGFVKVKIGIKPKPLNPRPKNDSAPAKTLPPEATPSPPPAEVPPVEVAQVTPPKVAQAPPTEPIKDTPTEIVKDSPTESAKPSPTEIAKLPNPTPPEAAPTNNGAVQLPPEKPRAPPPEISSAPPPQRKLPKSFGSKLQVFEHAKSDVPSWAKSPGNRSTPSSSPAPGVRGSVMRDSAAQLKSVLPPLQDTIEESKTPITGPRPVVTTVEAKKDPPARRFGTPVNSPRPNKPIIENSDPESKGPVSFLSRRRSLSPRAGLQHTINRQPEKMNERNSEFSRRRSLSPRPGTKRNAGPSHVDSLSSFEDSFSSLKKVSDSGHTLEGTNSGRRRGVKPKTDDSKPDSSSSLQDTASLDSFSSMRDSRSDTSSSVPRRNVKSTAEPLSSSMANLRHSKSLDISPGQKESAPNSSIALALASLREVSPKGRAPFKNPKMSNAQMMKMHNSFSSMRDYSPVHRSAIGFRLGAKAAIEAPPLSFSSLQDEEGEEDTVRETSTESPVSVKSSDFQGIRNSWASRKTDASSNSPRRGATDSPTYLKSSSSLDTSPGGKSNGKGSQISPRGKFDTTSDKLQEIEKSKSTNTDGKSEVSPAPGDKQSVPAPSYVSNLVHAKDDLQRQNSGGKSSTLSKLGATPTSGRQTLGLPTFLPFSYAPMDSPPTSPPLSLTAAALATPRRGRRRDSSQFASSKNAILEAMTTPARKQKEAALEITRTPRTLKRGFVELNIGTPRVRRGSKSPTPPQRFMDNSHHDKDKAQSYVDSAVAKLTDKSKAKEVESLVKKIEDLNGFPKTRRLSMRDNVLVGRLVMAIRNDPQITQVHVDSSLLGTVGSTLLSQFIDTLRLNLHVRSLSFHGAELGNDFLYALAASMESNFVVEEIDLSQNCFTSEGLANFCQALASTNDSVKSLNLKNQTTPISEASEVDVLSAFDQNTTLTNVQVDFMSDDGPAKLEKLLQRNQELESSQSKDVDAKLLSLLAYEAERAQELWDQQQADANMVEDEVNDWTYFHELAVLFDKHKLKKEVEDNAKAAFVPATQRKNADDLSSEEKSKFLFGQFKKNMEESVMAFNADGSFLTPEFIAKYFKEVPDEDALEFDFHGQWKLFKRFPIHDPDRQLIVDKFVDAIVRHPRANELTGINMANTGAGDDFLVALSDRCLKDDSLLPNLHTVNFETNYINEPGVVALAELVASPTSCKYMQVIRLENQKGLLKSKAEFALAKAMRVNKSIVVVSLTIRNLLEKERINKYVMRNVDLLRQARQEHMKATGTQRKRNKVELVFDSVKANDENVVVVNMTGNERFLTLTKEEKAKAASSFAQNSHVKEVLLNGCGIDDAFAKVFGEAIRTNSTIEKVHMEANDLSGEGIKALFAGLGANTSIRELRLHKQSKLLASADEDALADLLEKNTTITFLGIDLRSKPAKIKLDRKTADNINLELKQRAEAKGEDFVAKDSLAVLKF